MIQVNVPNFFYFDEISKIMSLGSKTSILRDVAKNAQKLTFFGPSILIFEISSKKNWNINLDHFLQLFFSKLFSPTNFIFRHKRFSVQSDDQL